MSQCCSLRVEALNYVNGKQTDCKSPFFYAYLQSDLGSSIREIDLGSHPMPDCKALGIVWDVENDRLRICGSSALSEVSTRRKMLRRFASHFDSLGILAPFLLKGKLILQKVTLSGIRME